MYKVLGSTSLGYSYGSLPVNRHGVSTGFGYNIIVGL